MKETLIINCDGGARGNPGPAASAFVITNTLGETVAEGTKFLGVTTNNEAEYKGVLLAYQWLTENKKENFSLEFFLDSQLVVMQLLGRYKITSPHLKLLAETAKEMQKNFLKVNYTFVARDKNKEADFLVNQCLDSSTGKTS